MIIGIDFGITNTDIVAYKENNYEFFSIKSEKLNTNFLEKIFDFINICLLYTSPSPRDPH